MTSPNPGNVIVLRHRDGGRPVVRQRDLEELLLLTRELREAELRWVNKRVEIRSALRAGAAVEPGVHCARVECSMRLIVR